jgi:hypothetical protein
MDFKPSSLTRGFFNPVDEDFVLITFYCYGNLVVVTKNKSVARIR